MKVMLLLRSTILVFGLMLSCGISRGSPATSGILCGHSHCGILVSRTEALHWGRQYIGGLTKPAVPADKAKNNFENELARCACRTSATLQLSFKSNVSDRSSIY